LGGADGVSKDDLRQFLRKVPDLQVRNALLRNFDEIFDKFDVDKNGTIDIHEFYNMLHGSTLMETAVYQVFMHIDTSIDTSGPRRSSLWNLLDPASVFLILLNCAIVGVSLEHEPDALYWQHIQIGFFFLLVVEFGLRCYEYSVEYKSKNTGSLIGVTLRSFQGFVAQPVNCFDIFIILMAAVEVIIDATGHEQNGLG
jgi:hypothetical protein